MSKNQILLLDQILFEKIAKKNLTYKISKINDVWRQENNIFAKSKALDETRRSYLID